MIGCGALGCEISKNLGIMGFCQSNNGNLVLTDMDSIELSNLSRQFLFQMKDLGKMKSHIVLNKLKTYFNDINLTSFDKQVGKENEDIFNSKFWKEKDIIINALDNINARLYVDHKCNLHEKPLFESGTLGTKANSQPIIPYKTATYSEFTDPEIEDIPMCTIKTFPNKLEHCVEWGIELFKKIFTQSVTDLKLFYKSLF